MLKLKVLANPRHPDLEKFKQLTEKVGKSSCYDTDLPFTREEHSEWHNGMERGERRVMLAFIGDELVGTGSIIKGSLAYLPSNGTAKLNVVSGSDITACFVVSEYRRKGIYKKIFEAAVEMSKEPYVSVSTGQSAYQRTNPILSRLLDIPYDELKDIATVVLFDKFKLLEGRQLDPEDMAVLRKVIVDGVNPNSIAVKVVAEKLVGQGRATFLGYSVDGAEPIYKIISYGSL